jgi:hypothetical protein
MMDETTEATIAACAADGHNAPVIGGHFCSACGGDVDAEVIGETQTDRCARGEHDFTCPVYSMTDDEDMSDLRGCANCDAVTDATGAVL